VKTREWFRTPKGQLSMASTCVALARDPSTAKPERYWVLALESMLRALR
jgi:hypothetical protein